MAIASSRSSGASSPAPSSWRPGVGLAIYSVNVWFDAHLAALDPTEMMRYAIPSVTLMIAGAEIVFASFVLSFIEPLQPGRELHGAA